MAINIYTVENDLEQHGWHLLSDSYKNLQTPLLMTCANGHTIEATYADFRKYSTNLCVKCLTGDNKEFINKREAAKSEGSIRILALDAATKTTGYAVFENTELAFYGHIIFKDDNSNRRIRELKNWLFDFILKYEIDYVVLEDIFLDETPGKNVDVFKVLAQLQGVIIDTLIGLNKKYFIVRPVEWRKTHMITGSKRDIVKTAALQKAIELFKIQVSQDEAEAVLIGNHALKTYWAELGL